MIYNRKTVATLIKQNVGILNEKIKNYDGVHDSNIAHVLSWKEKNLMQLHNWQYISDEEIRKYIDRNDLTFTPEIIIK